MSTVKLFSVTEVANLLEKNPATFTVEVKKDSKEYQGTTFYNNKIRAADGSLHDAYYRGTDLVLATSVADPNNKDDVRNKFEGTRMQIEFKLSKSGELGRMLNLLNPVFKAAVEKHNAEGTIIIGKREVHPLLQTHYSEENPDKEKRGQPLADPTIRFKIDFRRFPDKYPKKFLAGKQKTQIFDYTKPYVVRDGKNVDLNEEERRHIEAENAKKEPARREKIQFHPATVVNPTTGVEEPIDGKNMHLFLKRGALIKRYHLDHASTSRSQSWISAPLMALELVVQPAQESGFEEYDEDGYGTTNSSTTNAANNTNVVVVQATPQEKPTAEEVDDTLGDI